MYKIIAYYMLIKSYHDIVHINVGCLRLTKEIIIYYKSTLISDGRWVKIIFLLIL